MAQPCILNFHGIGTPQRALEEGEGDLWVTPERFAELLDVIARLGEDRFLKITFDDGNYSDRRIALPSLLHKGLRASFFVLSGKIGADGYLDADGIRDLKTAGMEIGLHGMDHVAWPRQDRSGLRREIVEARQILELTVGAPVSTVAIPFGRYNRTVMSALLTQGFSEIYTSDQGTRLLQDRVKPRFTMRADTTPAGLESLIRHSSDPWQRCITEVKYQIKRQRISI